MYTFCLNDTEESILAISQILVVRKYPMHNLEIFFRERQHPLIFYFTNQKDRDDNYERLIYTMSQS